jgi:hypothetical protein
MPIRHKSIKLVRADRLKTFMDRRLIKALHHPVREHILAVLSERAASPVEIGDEIDLDVTAFHKQVEFLEELDLIELVGEGPVRGATEHFYRAKPSIVFDDRAWELAPDSFRWDFDAKILQALLRNVAKSFKDGTFNARPDRHMTWMPLVLDAKGWREAMKLLAKTMRQLLAISRRSDERLLRAGEKGIPVAISILGFQRSTD